MTTASRSAKRKPARKKKSSSAARPADPNPAPAGKTPDDGPAVQAGGGGSFVQSVRDGSAFGAVARWSCGHAWFVVLAFLALAIGGATLAATKLKVDTCFKKSKRSALAGAKRNICQSIFEEPSSRGSVFWILGSVKNHELGQDGRSRFKMPLSKHAF